jgi:hypothetical protein
VFRDRTIPSNADTSTVTSNVKNSIYYHVYISRAVKPFTTAELAELLSKARTNNAAQGITGLLLYQGGTFMQALEGPQHAVDLLVNRIEADPRHRRMMKLLSGFQEGRQFPDWSMGFPDLNSAAVRALPGFNEFLRVPLEEEALLNDHDRCRQVLNTFKKLTF